MDIISIIGQYAFPIVACVAMGWYLKDQTDKNREQFTKISEAHKMEINEINQAIHNNTLALQRLVDLLGGTNVKRD